MISPTTPLAALGLTALMVAGCAAPQAPTPIASPPIIGKFGEAEGCPEGTVPRPTPAGTAPQDYPFVCVPPPDDCDPAVSVTGEPLPCPPPPPRRGGSDDDDDTRRPTGGPRA